MFGFKLILVVPARGDLLKLYVQSREKLLELIVSKSNVTEHSSRGPEPAYPTRLEHQNCSGELSIRHNRARRVSNDRVHGMEHAYSLEEEVVDADDFVKRSTRRAERNLARTLR